MSGEAWISAAGGTRIPLELETIDDGFGKSIVRHEYPHVDGADLEDMGQTGRTVRMRAFFWDEPHHFGYDNHRAVLALLEATGFLELNHPAYGLLNGKAEQITVRHDDSERYAEVDFSFIEQLRGAATAVQVVDVLATMEQAYTAALDEELARIKAAAVAEVGGQADGILDIELDPDLEILGQFTGVSRAAWGYVKKVDAAVRKLEGTLAEIALPANSLISTIDFATNLPGRLMGAVAQCVERYSVLTEKLAGAPLRFLDSLRGGLLQLEAALPDFSSQLRAAGAARACLALGEVFGADNDARRANQAAAATPAFDARGNRIPSAAPQPVLTVQEMEAAVALARTWIQEAIGLDRSRTELKAMGRALVDHLNQVKIESENLVAVEIDQPLPLHLVCLKYGISYRDAERLLAVNRIRRPNFTQGEVLVYAR